MEKAAIPTSTEFIVPMVRVSKAYLQLSAPDSPRIRSPPVILFIVTELIVLVPTEFSSHEPVK